MAHFPVPYSISQNITLFQCCINRLSGSIPNEIAALSRVQFVDLSFNNITGTLPSARHAGQRIVFESA